MQRQGFIGILHRIALSLIVFSVLGLLSFDFVGQAAAETRIEFVESVSDGDVKVLTFAFRRHDEPLCVYTSLPAALPAVEYSEDGHVVLGLEIEVLNAFGKVVRPFSPDTNTIGFDVPEVQISELRQAMIHVEVPKASMIIETAQKLRVKGFYFECPTDFEIFSSRVTDIDNARSELDRLGYPQTRFKSSWLVHSLGEWQEED